MMFTKRNGLHCVPGDFCIDPVRSAHTAVITHGHSDHARKGMQHYITHKHNVPILHHRLGTSIRVTALEYDEVVKLGDAWVSLHPAGHVIGSSQVRVEYKNEVWVITGDYKRDDDPIAAPFQVVECDTLVTECTFGLPIYQWPHMDIVMRQIHSWWQQNVLNGITSVINVYPLGKAQRILCELDPSVGTVYVDDAIHRTNQAIRTLGIELPSYSLLPVVETNALVLTSVGATGNRFHGPNSRISVATASGWNVSQKRNRNQAAGFVVSDHADWPTLIQTVRDSNCSRVIAMHGDTRAFVQFLQEQGTEAYDVSELLKSG
jgi:putative mRNA 3-end processing factor